MHDYFMHRDIEQVSKYQHQATFLYPLNQVIQYKMRHLQAYHQDSINSLEALKVPAVAIKSSQITTL